jgi:hypothetical protein
MRSLMVAAVSLAALALLDARLPARAETASDAAA